MQVSIYFLLIALTVVYFYLINHLTSYVNDQSLMGDMSNDNVKFYRKIAKIASWAWFILMGGILLYNILNTHQL